VPANSPQPRNSGTAKSSEPGTKSRGQTPSSRDPGSRATSGHGSRVQTPGAPGQGNRARTPGTPGHGSRARTPGYSGHGSRDLRPGTEYSGGRVPSTDALLPGATGTKRLKFDAVALKVCVHVYVYIRGCVRMYV
jgi:hypothetical protein